MPSLGSPKSQSAISRAASEVQLLNASIDEDDDDFGDSDRLEAVKTLLFNTYRIQNRAGMQLDDFIKDLDFIFKV